MENNVETTTSVIQTSNNTLLNSLLSLPAFITIKYGTKNTLYAFLNCILAYDKVKTNFAIPLSSFLQNLYLNNYEEDDAKDFYKALQKTLEGLECKLEIKCVHPIHQEVKTIVKSSKKLDDGKKCLIRNVVYSRFDGDGWNGKRVRRNSF